MADKFKDASGTVAGAVEGAYSEIEELRNEISSWKDGLPENLQNSQKAEELDACMEALSNVEYPPDAPEGTFMEAQITWKEVLPKKSWGKVYMSRKARLNNALAAIDAAITSLENVPDDQDGSDEAHTYASELREHHDEFDGAEFPRAF